MLPMNMQAVSRLIKRGAKNRTALRNGKDGQEHLRTPRNRFVSIDFPAGGVCTSVHNGHGLFQWYLLHCTLL